MNKAEPILAHYCLYTQPLMKGCAAREPLAYLCLTRLAVSGVFERPFNKMMPRGPGILSVRDA